MNLKWKIVIQLRIQRFFFAGDLVNMENNEPKSPTDSSNKDKEHIKRSSQNSSALYIFSIGRHIIDIPKSSHNIVSPFLTRGSLPSLNVSRVWIEKKEAEYILHIGDIDEVPFD